MSHWDKHMHPFNRYWYYLIRAWLILNCQHFCRARPSRDISVSKKYSYFQTVLASFQGSQAPSHQAVGGWWFLGVHAYMWEVRGWQLWGCRSFSANINEIQMSLKFILKATKLTEKVSKKKEKWGNERELLEGTQVRTVSGRFFQLPNFPRISASSKWP